MKYILLLMAMMNMAPEPVTIPTEYVIEQVAQIPSPTTTANFLNHGNRTLVKCGTTGALYPVPNDAKTWLFVGGFAWQEFEKSRTLYIRNFYNLFESRDLVFPNDGLHNGISSTFFHKESGYVYVLFTSPNTVSAVNPVTLEWHDVAHIPYESNAQFIIHRDSVYVATQTSPSRLYRYNVYGVDDLQGYAEFDPPMAHMVIAWGDWIYTTNGDLNQPITLTAHDWQTCEAQFQTDFSDLGQDIGTHTAAIVPGPTESEAYLVLGPEGATQHSGENQALIWVDLSNWSRRGLVKPFGDDFQEPIWGVKYTHGLLWVTYGCADGGRYVAFDPTDNWKIKRDIKLPPQFSYINGDATVIGNELVGTRFEFGPSGLPSTMFRLMVLPSG